MGMSMQQLADDAMSPATLVAATTSPLIAPLSTLYREGACCSTMSKDLLMALLEMTCFDTPIISGTVGTLFGTLGLGADLPDACEGFYVPEYVNKPADECPTFQESMKKIVDFMDN